MPKRLTTEELQRIIKEKKGIEYEKIKKETERKIFIIKHKREIIKYSIIMGIIIVSIIFIIPFLTFFIQDLLQHKKVASTNNNETENQTNTDNVEKPPENFKIEILETKLIKTEKKKVYDVLAKARNADPEWGVSKLSYNLFLKDKDGDVVGERERESYVLPQQERYIIEIGIETLVEAESVELETTLLEVQKLEQFTNPQTQISKKNIKYFVGGEKSRAEGTLINKSSFGFDRVDVYVILYDSEDNIVGINYTNFNAFLPASERYFSVFWPEVIANENLRVEIEPDVNIFELGSFMDIYGTGQKLDY